MPNGLQDAQPAPGLTTGLKRPHPRHPWSPPCGGSGSLSAQRQVQLAPQDPRCILFHRSFLSSDPTLQELSPPRTPRHTHTRGPSDTSTCKVDMAMPKLPSLYLYQEYPYCSPQPRHKLLPSHLLGPPFLVEESASLSSLISPLGLGKVLWGMMGPWCQGSPL